MPEIIMQNALKFRTNIIKQNKELVKINLDIQYNNEKEILKKFLMFYKENNDLKYLNQIISNQEIEINLNDLFIYLNSEVDNNNLYSRILSNTFSYIRLFYNIIDELKYENTDLNNETDVFSNHRISRFKEKYPDLSIADVIGFLLRDYIIKLSCSTINISSIRELNSAELGSIKRVKGIVIRITQVKPAIKVATYICEACGTETYQQINNNDTFDLLEECNGEKCKQRKIRGALCLISRGSKFVKYQKLYIQEINDTVPQGCIPRVLQVDVYGNDTEKLRPGENVVITGIFLPKPYYGFKKLKAGLINDTYLYSTKIEQSTFNINYKEVSSYEILKSFAPEIFGMEDVKKLLLLLLIGNKEIVKNDGMRIRGNINILLVGDPGIAKSQLLKTVCKLSRRGIYTTGKSSTAAGLTASISKDPITGEYILEGGALVLADKGVCCIDEFDKMSEIDRVSIHEIMEQQSISVSKAGINTTLNARCSILAAANPVKGRYDIKKSLEYNINLPISLLSRFDIIVVLKDDQNENVDLELAEHITNIHLEENINFGKLLSYDELKEIIERKKKIEVQLNENLKNKIVDIYTKKRKIDESLTPRYVLSIIRLASAHAKLNTNLDKIDITNDDIDEAVRLLDLYTYNNNLEKNKTSIKHIIYTALCAAAEDGVVDLIKFYQNNNYKKETVKNIIKEFSEIGIWIEENNELIFYN